MMRQVLLTSVISLAAVLVGSIQPAANARGGEVRMRVTHVAQDNSPPYVAVMGQIGRPGVFELSRPLPQLAEFLNLAGGTTPDASGSIRLIRGGRSSQFFLSPKLSLQLIPGDLLVVESKQAVAGSQYGSSAAADGHAGPNSAVVQIGLVNLIRRPVILDIPSEQANVAQVLSILHQPVNANAEITLIAPGAGVQNVAVEQAFDATLSTGMVLVFDPATVNSAVLPRMPNVRRPTDDAEPSAPSSSAVPAASAVAPKPVSSIGPAVHSEPPGNQPLLVPQATLPGAADRVGPSPIPESAETSSAGSDAETSETSSAAVPSTDSIAESADVQGSPDASDEKVAEKESAAASGQPVSSILWQLTVAGLVAGGIGIMLRTRARRQPPAVTVRPQREPALRPRDELELLISGELPIVEEPLQLPYESEIFGRPLETSAHRTDPAQTLTGPHYNPEPIPATTPTDAVPIAAPAETAPAPASASTERKVRVDMRHPRSTVSVLDRALASFQGDQP